MVRKFLITTAITVVAIGGSTACATKKFVRTSVGEVNTKVDSLGRSVEETQERTRQNEGKIADVDQRAQAAAQAARQAADQANTAAGAANQQAMAAGESARTANAKALEVEKNARKIVYEVVLNENQGNFKFGDISLPDAAKARIDEMVTQIKADPKGAYFEIEGHTDNVGDKTTNERIGLNRAEAVKRYLYEQHQIPLHRMNVISYGEDKPASPNNTRDGRAQNRRVVIRVLA
jgi:outer membrane protein OmpA-like peptidoglycan-associated protein